MGMEMVFFFLGAAVSSASSGFFSKDSSNMAIEYTSSILYAFIALGLFLIEK